MSCCPQELCPVCGWRSLVSFLSPKYPSTSSYTWARNWNQVKDLHDSEADALQALGSETVKAPAEIQDTFSSYLLYSLFHQDKELALASCLSDLSQSNAKGCLRAEHSCHKELEDCRDNQERKGENILHGPGSWHTPIGNRRQRQTDEESKFRVISSSPEELRAVFPLRKTPWSAPVAANATVRGQEGHSEGCKHSSVSLATHIWGGGHWAWTWGAQGGGLEGFWRQNQGDQRLLLLTGCLSASPRCPKTQENAAFEDKGFRPWILCKSQFLLRSGTLGVNAEQSWGD